MTVIDDREGRDMPLLRAEVGSLDMTHESGPGIATYGMCYADCVGLGSLRPVCFDSRRRIWVVGGDVGCVKTTHQNIEIYTMRSSN